MKFQADTYQAYLLRFRRQNRSQPWRVSTHDIRTEAQYCFATLDELIAFLETQLDLDYQLEAHIHPIKLG